MRFKNSYLILENRWWNGGITSYKLGGVLKNFTYCLTCPSPGHQFIEIQYALHKVLVTGHRHLVFPICGWLGFPIGRVGFELLKVGDDDGSNGYFYGALTG